MDSAELEAIAEEYGLSVDILRTLTGISDPANDHLFTREALSAALKCLDENRPAFDSSNAFVEQNGLPLASKKKRPGRGAVE